MSVEEEEEEEEEEEKEGKLNGVAAGQRHMLLISGSRGDV